MNVSVVIPVFNEELYLEKCLQSLQQQSEKPYEIIIVDNNSSDNSIAVAQKFPVTIIHQKEKGIIPTRNVGFDTAKGDIIARCDADCILPLDWIKNIKEDFQNQEIDALSGPFTFYDLPKNPLIRLIYGNMKWYITLSHIFQGGKETLLGINMMLTKKMWNKVKKYACTDDSKIHEDFDLTIHINHMHGLIGHDDRLKVQTSSRRLINDPVSWFGEYHWRFLKTVIHRYVVALSK